MSGMHQNEEAQAEKQEAKQEATEREIEVQTLQGQVEQLSAQNAALQEAFQKRDALAISLSELDQYRQQEITALRRQVEQLLNQPDESEGHGSEGV